MRNQLQTFTDLANTLLPHETEYLLSVQQFKDEERLAILRQVAFNSSNIEQFTPYDTNIDKRKYNHLQNWITNRLKAIDVDEQFHWMLDMEQKIMTDTIRPSEEKELLKAIRNYTQNVFFFSKFYEVVEHYRHFLLVRIRYNDHQSADDFLTSYREEYIKAKKVYERLHEATLDIVGQYSGESVESKQWEEWLTEVFYNEQLEGHIRYLALVRSVFIAHNYRKYDLLREKFDYLGKSFSQGRYYSKRLLLNYYSNRLMLHSHFREYEQAVYYGYLSTRAKTHDYLFYVNNLCAVLLRLDRQQEALQLMQKAAPEAKKTKNFHNRVGYVAFYMEALNKNNLYKNAIGYGDSFLKAFAKEVIQYRWHLFFSVYLESLMLQGQYEKLIKISQRFKLMERDKDYRTNAGYLPAVPLYIEAARYKEGLIQRKDFLTSVNNHIGFCQQSPELSKGLKKLVTKFERWVPDVSTQLQQMVL